MEYSKVERTHAGRGLCLGGNDETEGGSRITNERFIKKANRNSDGPFAETREQLGGYYLIDAKKLDEAIAIAARIPPGRLGTVEIRPVMEIPGLPANKSCRMSISCAFVRLSSRAGFNRFRNQRRNQIAIHDPD